MLFANKELTERGFITETLGLFSGDDGNFNNKDIILLPAPVTRNGVDINCPLTNKQIPLDILNSAQENTKIFGGGKLGFKNYTDYLALDGYAIKNAVLTAEGAISYAIENTAFSLWKSRILIIGYGRVGKVLAERIKGFKPRLTVTARNERDFATLQMLGINHIGTSEIANCKERFDIVFNTVDIKLSPDTASALSSSLFLDLSTSGGFLYDDLEKFNIKYTKLPGIPGKTAPDTAGRIIAETVIKYSM